MCYGVGTGEGFVRQGLGLMDQELSLGVFVDCRVRVAFVVCDWEDYAGLKECE